MFLLLKKSKRKEDFCFKKRKFFLPQTQNYITHTIFLELFLSTPLYNILLKRSRTNQSLTVLGLVFNEITDEGVRFLADPISHCNTNL